MKKNAGDTDLGKIPDDINKRVTLINNLKTKHGANNVYTYNGRIYKSK